MPKLTLALPALVALSLLSAPTFAAEGKWQEVSRKGDLVIYKRDRPDSDLKEVKAVGVIDAPHWVVKNVIDDKARYKEFMPYTKASTVIKKERDTIVTYQRLDTPIISNRDYTIRVKDESRRLPDGRIVYKSSWTPANHLGPKEIDGVVRVKVNEGYWLLEEDGPNKTRATYYLFTDPGGSLPSFIVNSANTTAIPDLFKAIEGQAKGPRYRQTRPTLPADENVAPPTTLESVKQ